MGKSTLIKRYCESRFVQKYIPTIGIDYGVKPVRVLGHDLKVNFFDTSGAAFTAVRKLSETHSSDLGRAVRDQVLPRIVLWSKPGHLYFGDRSFGIKLSHRSLKLSGT